MHETCPPNECAEAIPISISITYTFSGIPSGMGIE